MRVLILFLALLFLLPAADAAAGKKAAPPKYVGVWASPDCNSDSQTMVFTPHYFLKSTEAATVFSAAEVTARKKDYEIVTFHGAAQPVTRTEDGLLTVGTIEPEVKDVKDWPPTWDELPLQGRSEYSHCAAISPVVPVPLARVMEKIEAVQGACAAAVTPACGKLLFTMADSNGNKRLSLSEFKKTGAMLGTLLPLLGGRAVPTAELEAGYKQGIEDGARIAALLLAARDKDGSNDLDAKEMAGFLKDADDPALKKTLAGLAVLFPAFLPEGMTAGVEPPEVKAPETKAPEAKTEDALGDLKKAVAPVLEKLKVDNTYRMNP